MSVIADIEDALVTQWSHFGRWPKGELHEADGLVWFETPIKHLPYNGVVRTRLDESAAPDRVIAAVMERFRARGADCFWAVHPSATPSDLARRLTMHSLRPVEQMTCMSLELADWETPPLPGGVTFEEVIDDAGLERYTNLTLRYWEIPDAERELVAEVHGYWRPGRTPGHRYLALLDGEAIGKGYVSLAGPPGVASIYGMSVLPQARGRGVAGGLTTTLLQRAKGHGCSRAVLHATDMAVGVYLRAGFLERCTIEVFATASLWEDGH